MVWIKATYQPVTLYSLRPSWTTSSGGKSLLLYAPYALKMALLDVAIRTSGLQQAEKAWPWIRDLEIGIRPPGRIVVSNLFAKILKVRRNPANPGSADFGPFQKTIAYREYVYHQGAIDLLFGASAANALQLQEWLVQIDYIGKRGGFVQLMALPTQVEESDGFVMLTQSADSFPLNGVAQQLDDCDPKMNFIEANIYESKKPKRITRHIILPYRLARSSRSYSLYEHVPT